MKKKTTTFLALLISFVLYSPLQSQTVCDTAGNLIIYSGYSGGVLKIDVDVNIPNLRIGVVSFNTTQIVVSGTYANNVVAVEYAGVNRVDSAGCIPQAPYSVTLTGAPNATLSIQTEPPITYVNPNGNYIDQKIYCSDGTCDTTVWAGGCNTPDEILYYFLQTLGGTFRYQYLDGNCWPATTRTVSSGGNCCILPTMLPTGIAAQNQIETLEPYFSNDNLMIHLPSSTQGKQITLDIFDAQGKLLDSKTTTVSNPLYAVDGLNVPNGLLLIRARWDEGQAVGRISRVQ